MIYPAPSKTLRKSNVGKYNWKVINYSCGVKYPQEGAGFMSKIRERAKPYLYEAGDKLAILVHGFTGTPDDMRELAKYLAAKGISAKAIRLAGHGTTDWQDLEQSSYYDWWKTLEDEVREAANKYRKIYLIGYSFGANLSFDIAARYPDLIEGVVSLGISVYLRKEWFVRLALPIFHNFLKRIRKRYIKKEHLAEYLNSGSQVFVSTKSIYDFYHFIDRYTKKELGKVTVPALIIHSRDDSVTHPSSSEFVHARISSPQKELIILDDINHNPIRSQRKNIIYTKIEGFIQHNF